MKIPTAEKVPCAEEYECSGRPGCPRTEVRDRKHTFTVGWGRNGPGYVCHTPGGAGKYCPETVTRTLQRLALISTMQLSLNTTPEVRTT